MEADPKALQKRAIEGDVEEKEATDGQAGSRE